MVFKAVIKKELPKMEGTSEKGKWELFPFVFEFTEDTPRGPMIHACVQRFNPNYWEIEKIREALNMQTTLEVNVSIDVVKGDKGSFNEVNLYIRDEGYRKPREY